MKLTKTDYMAQITQRLDGRTDRIDRRVWEDENGNKVVKVMGSAISLNWYRLSAHHTVTTWYDPCH